MSAREVTQQERLARARTALSALPGVLQDTLVVPWQGQKVRPEGAQPQSAARVVPMPGQGRERAFLPLSPALQPLLPGGLPRGGVVTVTGSTSLLWALAGQASRDGAWVAVVGMPDAGMIAAARQGMDLSRVVLIPHPGTHAPAVLAACVEGMEVVIAGPSLALSEPDRRRLTARARVRAGVIISAGAWTGARLELTATRMRWQGLGAGDGRLRERETTVAVRERGGMDRIVELMLERHTGAWSPEARATAPVHEVA